MLGNPIEASEAPVAALSPDRRKERREVRGRGRDIFWGQAIGYPRFGQGREVVLGGGASEEVLRRRDASGGQSLEVALCSWGDRL